MEARANFLIDLEKGPTCLVKFEIYFQRYPHEDFLIFIVINGGNVEI